MASEKITMYRTNEDQTVVIEQLPKTVTSQVYDSENEQFLDTTIEDINTEITEHKAQKGQPNGYASLDANGKVPSSQISISGGGGVVEDASTTQKGIVKLNTSTNSTSTTEAATPSSVKAAYDLANGKYTKPQTGIPSSDLTSDVQTTLNKVVDGTTTTKGIVQLTNSTSSTSTTTAATPNSVKSAYDLANGKYTKPSTGIPVTDLDTSLQTTLNDALTTLDDVLTTLDESGVSVKDFGAKGDNTTDDSVAFQTAFDYCYENNKTCFIPDGNYIVNNTLIIPPELTLVGTNRVLGGKSNEWQKSNCLVVMNNMTAFTGREPDMDSQITFVCRDVFFKSGQNSASNVLFKDILFTNSEIHRNQFVGFGVILQGGLSRSAITNNGIYSLAGSFILQSSREEDSATLVDCAIRGNRIVGSHQFNPIIFDVAEMGYAVIQDNYFSIAKILLKCSYAGTLSTFSGNLVEYVFRGFVGNYSALKITNNSFAFIASNRVSTFTNADNEMKTQQWACITMADNLKDVLIANNQTEYCQNFVFSLPSSVNTSKFERIKIVDNSYDNQIVSKVEYRTAAMDAASKDIVIDDLMNLKVTTLPSAAIQGVPETTTFDGQTIVYNGKTLRNDNGTWTDLSGEGDALATHNNDYLKHGITGTTSGSANTYILTPSPALSSYTKGLRVTLFVNVANTGSSTLNISGLGVKTLKKNDGSTYGAGELKINTPYTFVYNGTDFLADSTGGGEGGGKKQASGTTTRMFPTKNYPYFDLTTSISSYVTVSGLSFRPSRIVMHKPNLTVGDYIHIYSQVLGDQYEVQQAVMMTTNYNPNAVSFSWKVNVNGLNGYVNATGFELPVISNADTLVWTAYE